MARERGVGRSKGSLECAFKSVINPPYGRVYSSVLSLRQTARLVILARISPMYTVTRRPDTSQNSHHTTAYQNEDNVLTEMPPSVLGIHT